MENTQCEDLSSWETPGQPWTVPLLALPPLETSCFLDLCFKPGYLDVASATVFEVFRCPSLLLTSNLCISIIYKHLNPCISVSISSFLTILIKPSSFHIRQKSKLQDLQGFPPVVFSRESRAAPVNPETWESSDSTWKREG